MFHPQKEIVYAQHATSDSKSLLATLRTDASLFKKVETLCWRGPTPGFAAWADRMKAPGLLERCQKAMRK